MYVPTSHLHQQTQTIELKTLCNFLCKQTLDILPRTPLIYDKHNVNMAVICT